MPGVDHGSTYLRIRWGSRRSKNCWISGANYGTSWLRISRADYDSTHLTNRWTGNSSTYLRICWRSRYSSNLRISGVTWNGQLWQALITINKRKTYIGSYESERDAAIAFDFYCMLLHSLRAKTNFNYSKKNTLCMVENFKENNNCFKPELLDLD